MTEDTTPNATNRIALNDELVKRINTLHNSARDNITELALLAYNVHAQYISADGRKYDPEFEKWWDNYDLRHVFRDRSMFSKYVGAGKAWERSEVYDYRERMPVTLTALYEISQLTAEEIGLCLENRYTRRSIGGEKKGLKKPMPVIYPTATDKDIRNWRKRWRNPEGNAASDHVSIGTLTIARSIWHPTDDGLPDPIVIEKLPLLEQALLNAVEPFNDCFGLTSCVAELMESARNKVARKEKNRVKKKN